MTVWLLMAIICADKPDNGMLQCKYVDGHRTFATEQQCNDLIDEKRALVGVIKNTWMVCEPHKVEGK